MEERFLQEERSFAERLRRLEQVSEGTVPQGGGTVVVTVTITFG
jgi:hypothetical protein